MRLFILMALAAIFTSTAQAAECERVSEVSELTQAHDEALTAFKKLNREGLLMQASAARAALSCVGGVLTKQDAASYHRLMGLEAFFQGNGRRASQEFHAALMLEAGYEFPEDVMDANHPVRMLYETAQHLPDGNPEKIYPPVGGYVIVGGIRNAARHKQTPVIIQVFESDGTLKETHYVQPGETTPNWSGNAFGLTAKDIGIDLEELQKPSLFTKPKAWYLGGGALATASSVMLTVAIIKRQQFIEPSTSDADRLELMPAANGLGTASMATGGVALAMFGTGLGLHWTFGPEGKTVSAGTTSEVVHVWQ